jgi:hypothetical protein
MQSTWATKFTNKQQKDFILNVSSSDIYILKNLEDNIYFKNYSDLICK